MPFKLDGAPANWYQPCSCGGPHGLAIYVDKDDGTLSLMDQGSYRLNDFLDLRGVLARIRTAWWILTGKHCGYADMVLVNDDVRKLAQIFADAADAQDVWRREAIVRAGGKPGE